MCFHSQILISSTILSRFEEGNRLAALMICRYKCSKLMFLYMTPTSAIVARFLRHTSSTTALRGKRRRNGRAQRAKKVGSQSYFLVLSTTCDCVAIASRTISITKFVRVFIFSQQKSPLIKKKSDVYIPPHSKYNMSRATSRAQLAAEAEKTFVRSKYI